MELEAIVAEYRSVGIGPLIYGEIRDLVRSVVRSYDPVVYGRVWRWDEGVDDLVQEFCVDVLIERGQLDYAVLTATDHQHFRRLIARQIRHLLARRRRRTIVDNILDRSRRIVSSPPFRLLTHRSGWSFTLEHRAVDPGRVSEEEFSRLVSRLAELPMLRSKTSSRAPIVYTSDSLRLLLETTAETLDHTVGVADLDRIMSSLLTSWLPSFLQEGDEADARPDTGVATSEERAMAREATERIIGECSQVQLQVLRLKLAGDSDREIAKRLDISRPTVAKRRDEVMNILADAMTGVSDTTQALVLKHLEATFIGAGGDENEQPR